MDEDQSLGRKMKILGCMKSESLFERSDIYIVQQDVYINNKNKRKLDDKKKRLRFTSKIQRNLSFLGRGATIPAKILNAETGI